MAGGINMCWVVLCSVVYALRVVMCCCMYMPEHRIVIGYMYIVGSGWVHARKCGW